MAQLIPIPGFFEPFSSLSHLLGAVIFAGFSVPLLLRGRGNGPRLVSLAIFCLGTVVLLAISGTYHLLDPAGAAKAIVRRLDHAGIFVLIACTFTPPLMILFRGKARWGLLLLVWTYAVIAITLKMIYFSQLSSRQGIFLYLCMGWISIFPSVTLWRRYGTHFIQPLVWGGIAYTIGALIESISWPVLIPGVVQWHETFHVMVLIGLGFHWAFVFMIADGRIAGRS